jgi:hypothetical protein
MGVQPFYGEGPRPLVWAVLRAARGRTIVGMTNRLNFYVIFTLQAHDLLSAIAKAENLRKPKVLTHLPFYTTVYKQ